MCNCTEIIWVISHLIAVVNSCLTILQLAVVNLLLWGAAYYVNYVGDLGHFGSVVYPATDRENPLEVN